MVSHGCRRSGNGGTQTCLPAACSVAQVGAQRGPSSSAQAQDPREGPSLVRGGGQEASSGAASSGRLARRRRDQGRGTLRGAHDASHDDRGQAGADLRSVLVSPLVQRGQAQAKAACKGYRFSATRPRPAERQDGGHRGAQDGITVKVFGSRRPTLVRISVLDVPLQNGQLLAPFPLNNWEEDQGLSI